MLRWHGSYSTLKVALSYRHWKDPPGWLEKKIKHSGQTCPSDKLSKRSVHLQEGREVAVQGDEAEPGPESFQRAGGSYHTCCQFVGILWGLHPKPSKIPSSLKWRLPTLTRLQTTSFKSGAFFFSLLWSFITKFCLRFHAGFQCLYLPFFFCETCQSSTLPSKNEAVGRPQTIYFHYVTTFPALFKMPIPCDGMLWFIIIAFGSLSKISISPLCIVLYALPAACRIHCGKNPSDIQVRIFVWAVSQWP